MTLSAYEFLRRFSTRILPSRFVKIRHYGILSNNARKALLPLAKKLIATTTGADTIFTKSDIIEQMNGHKPGICPHCGQQLQIVTSQHKKTEPGLKSRIKQIRLLIQNSSLNLFN